MQNIKHLYWRAGFGLSPIEWKQKNSWTIQRAVDDLFKSARNPKALPLPGKPDRKALAKLSQEEKAALLKKSRAEVASINTDWVLRMASPQSSDLLERMTLFWHGHFACRSRSGILAAQQLNTLREHALGSFRDLLIGVAKDPSMIRYLNNQQNKKRKPNENFARELMELFTIGHGNYSEKDIKEAARAFTGWSSTVDGNYIFRQAVHDTGSKTFMGKTGRFGGEDIIDLILERRETADFICRKVYRYFVNTKVNEQHVAEMSKTFYQSAYDIGKLMRFVLESNWFYAAENQGNKIKSPVELLAGLIRTMDLEFQNPAAIIFLQRAFGQILFNPPNVAGWPGGKNWIDNSTLMTRLNLAQSMIGTTAFNFRAKASLEDKNRGKSQNRLEVKANLKPLLDLVKGKNRTESIANLAEYILLSQPQVRPRMIEQFSPLEAENEFVALAAIRLMSLPEYQLC